MKLKLLNVSLIACLALTVNAYARPLPFFDKKPDDLTHIKKMTFSRNVSLTQYVKGSTLDLSYGGLEDTDMPAVINFLKNHPEIISLNLEGNGKLTGIGLVPLAAINTLVNLNLARNYKECPNNVCVGGLEAKDVIPFSKNTSLKVLNLDLHSIGDDGAIELAKNTHLEELYLSVNNITDIGGVVLAQHPTLKVLSLWANDQVGSKTAEMLAKNNNLYKLNLKQTSVQDQGATALAMNTHLTDLDLSVTNVTDIGAASFAKNSTLETLRIGGNSIGSAGGIALAANTSLTSLELDGDFWNASSPRIGDQGATAFGNNKTLQHLSVDDQHISLTGVTEIVKNSNLKSLWIGGNKLKDEGAIYISQHAPQLTDLVLYGSQLTDKGAQALASMHKLESLSLSSNFISDAGAESLSNNTSLKYLELIINEIHDDGAVALAQNRTLDTLWVPLNRIGVVGNQALENNHYIRHIETGGENPYPPPSQTNNIATSNYQPVNRMGYCYRTANKVQCSRANANNK